jgi:hypothetical protein
MACSAHDARAPVSTAYAELEDSCRQRHRRAAAAALRIPHAADGPIGVGVPAETLSLWAFPYVCPEPVLVKSKMARKDAIRYRSVFWVCPSPIEDMFWPAAGVSTIVFGEPAETCFLSTFPMFVPSLAWSNDQF